MGILNWVKAIISVATDEKLMKLYEERLKAKDDIIDTHKIRADFFKEQVDILKQEKEIKFQNQTEKDNKISQQNNLISTLGQLLTKANEDILKMKSAQINKPFAISGESPLLQALSNAIKYDKSKSKSVFEIRPELKDVSPEDIQIKKQPDEKKHNYPGYVERL